VNGRWSVTTDGRDRVLLSVRTEGGSLVATLSPDDAASVGEAMVRHAGTARAARARRPRRDDDYGQGAMDADEVADPNG
jgi:hypothetical protein